MFTNIVARGRALGMTVAAMPLPSLLLLLLVLGANILAWSDTRDLSTDLMETIGQLMMIFALGRLPLASVSKRRGLGRRQWAVGSLLVIALLMLQYIALPVFDLIPESFWYTYMALWVVSVLCLVAVPLVGRMSSARVIYSYVIGLVKHVALGAIFGGLLAGGLSLAIVGIEVLFDVWVASEWYGTIWSVAGWLLGGLVLLDGVRRLSLEYKDELVIPKWQVLLRSIVLLLVGVYGIILYAYLAKIVITGQWPSNQVGIWGFVFLGLAVGAGFLSHSAKSDKNSSNKKRRLYMLLLPICVMVGLAIHQRVIQYGRTEARYLVVVLLVWFVVMALYLSLSKRASFEWVFGSLGLFALVAARGGPLSARVVGYNSQSNLLSNFIEEHQLLDTDGKLAPDAASTLSDKETTQLWELIAYHIDHHGLYHQDFFNPQLRHARVLVAYLPRSLLDEMDELSVYKQRLAVLGYLGLPDYKYSDYSPTDDFSYYRLSEYNQPIAYSIDDARLLVRDVRLTTDRQSGQTADVFAGGKTTTFVLQDDSIIIRTGSGEATSIDLSMRLQTLEETQEHEDLGTDEMSVVGGTYRLLCEHVRGKKQDEGYIVDSIMCDVVVR